MKIGILTYHKSENYGAALQAYALKKVLKDLGSESVFIDYWPTYHRKMYSLYYNIKQSINREKYFLNKIRVLKQELNKIPNYIRRKRNFKQFYNNYLITNGIGKTCEEYDLIIYGSDQLWRKQVINNTKVYNWVYFGNNKLKSKRKITYAISMGTIDPSIEEEKHIKANLNHYDTISVREEELKLFLEKLSINDVKLCVDPTLLLRKEDWQILIDNSNIRIDEHYILYYKLYESLVSDSIVEEIKKKTGLKVIEINGHINSGNKDDYNTAGPCEFLYLIKNASFVVSSSFHGTVFSILFEKVFYCMMDYNYDRVKTLLKITNLEDRFIDSLNVELNDTIDYSNVNRNLHSLRDSSIQFIIQNIQK